MMMGGKTTFVGCELDYGSFLYVGPALRVSSPTAVPFFSGMAFRPGGIRLLAVQNIWDLPLDASYLAHEDQLLSVGKPALLLLLSDPTTKHGKLTVRFNHTVADAIRSQALHTLHGLTATLERVSDRVFEILS